MNTANSSQSSDVRSTILATGQRIMAGKGYSAVGLNEILGAAGVPKGSFYHYFSSKDAFGEAMLQSYFDNYLAEIDAILAQDGLTMAQRLMNYWQMWYTAQSIDNCQGKCLAVKLGAEVADLSDAMRAVLRKGTEGIVSRLARAIAAGVDEGSLAIEGEPAVVASSLYQLWLGASLMVKIARSAQPFETALASTRQMLHIAL